MYEAGKEPQRDELRNQIKHNCLAKDHVLALLKNVGRLHGLEDQ